MQTCMIRHTGVGEFCEGYIKDNRVYLTGLDGKQYYPEEMFMAREECEKGRIQFEVAGKWGIADIYSGKIMVEPVWDYVGPYYDGFAHVAIGTKVDIADGRAWRCRGGKHGFIDLAGNVVIPLEYDEAEDAFYGNKFKVARNGKWGLVDSEHRLIVPLIYERISLNYYDNLLFCSTIKCQGDGDIADDPDDTDYEAITDAMDLTVKEEQLLEAPDRKKCLPKQRFWSVYDKEGNWVIGPDLDEEPYYPSIKPSDGVSGKSKIRQRQYCLVRRKRKFGVLCKDGRMITKITLLKRDAMAIIQTLVG